MKLTRIRKLIQLVFLFLFVYILWATTYPLKSLFSPKIFFQWDPLLIFITAISERVIVPGMIFSAIMLGLTLIFGRFFCGWICPLGAIIDISGKLKKKKVQLSDRGNKKWSLIKYIVLVIGVVFALAGVQLVWVLDPIVIFGRVISLNVIPAVTLAIDKGFIFIIQQFGVYGGFYDFYRELKDSFLGVNVHFFNNSFITFFVVFVICIVSVFMTRSWCRFVCPLGALYGFFAKFSKIRRAVGVCRNCMICRKYCRMGAIQKDNSYLKRECILCLDCLYDCPDQSTRFVFSNKKNKLEKVVEDSGNEITRKNFLFLLLAGMSSLGFTKAFQSPQKVIRPPGVVNEVKFQNECVRCGNCMKVCITNGLQPVMFESGAQGVWTPKLVPEIGYCEYSCNLCSQVCPTGAIPTYSLEKKQQLKLGVAVINRSHCFAWEHNTNCLVCEEHCPIPDKAIKVREEIVNGEKILRPIVDPNLCIGCGICQNKCPARPQRAIQVQV